jgi:hypothetical protein
MVFVYANIKYEKVRVDIVTHLLFVLMETVSIYVYNARGPEYASIPSSVMTAKYVKFCQKMAALLLDV